MVKAYQLVKLDSCVTVQLFLFCAARFFLCALKVETTELP